MSTSPATIVEQHPAAIVVRVQPDKLDEEGMRPVQTEVSAAAAGAAPRPVVVDMSRVRFVASMSLAGMIRLLTECRDRKQRLILAGLEPEIRDVFRLTRLDRLFEFQPSDAAALKELGGD